MLILSFSASSIQGVDEIKTLPENGFIWIDADPQELCQVLEKIHKVNGVTLNEEHIRDCQNLQHPSFYEKTMSYDILIFRSLIANLAPRSIQTTAITFLTFSKILVTFHQNDEAINRIKKKLQNIKKILPAEPTNLMFSILDEIVDNFLLLKIPLLNEYNLWEKRLFDNTTRARAINWRKYLNFKTEARKLRILGEEQLEVIYQWRQDNEVGLNEELTIRYNDLLDHIKRVIRSSTQLESELDTLTQLHYSLISNRTNDTVRTLTVLSAIFLPLNLIAGIFGMNFQHMTIFQSYYAHDITLWGMLVLAVFLLFIFKWIKWI